MSMSVEQHRAFANLAAAYTYALPGRRSVYVVRERSDRFPVLQQLRDVFDCTGIDMHSTAGTACVGIGTAERPAGMVYVVTPEYEKRYVRTSRDRAFYAEPKDATP